LKEYKKYKKNYENIKWKRKKITLKIKEEIEKELLKHRREKN
jgi:hypothetical protein